MCARTASAARPPDSMAPSIHPDQPLAGSELAKWPACFSWAIRRCEGRPGEDELTCGRREVHGVHELLERHIEVLEPVPTQRFLAEAEAPGLGDDVGQGALEVHAFVGPPSRSRASSTSTDRPGSGLVPL
ncbi:hypothetical protein AB0M31_12965 [Streptomyces sp. NPDC051773]|uniref:hypothetical protein n=1 Tax=Streptomyces sp. NPDC051773 TaxID=3156682 RepID=UPI00342FE49D